MSLSIANKLKNAVLSIAVIGCLLFGFSGAAFANEYDCGTYGAGGYNQGQTCAATTDEEPDSGGTGGGSLINTGQALTLLFSAIIIIAGVTALYKLTKKPKNQ